MDKETLSNYGWIVIAVLVLVVMIALATPFGSFISEAVQSTTKGLFDVNKSALDSTGLINIDNQEFDVPDMNHGAENGGNAGETIIPEGGIYSEYIGDSKYNQHDAGAKFPELKEGDIYTYGDYYYQYTTSVGGWRVYLIDKTKTSYDAVLKSINGAKVVSLNQTFYGCSQITTVPVLHENITDMTYTFYGCKTLKDASNLQTATNVQNLYATFYDCNNLETGPSYLPSSVTNFDYTFYNCYALKSAPDMSALNNVKSMNATFHYCSSLTTISTLPSNVESLYWTFGNCRKLKTMSASIPSTVKDMTYTFGVCLLLEGDIEINANPTAFDSCFYGTEYYIYLTGSCTEQTKTNLAGTTVSSNVFVK